MDIKLGVLNPANLPDIASVLTAVERNTAQPRVVTADELLEEFDGMHTDPERDVLGVWHGDELIACGYTYLLVGEDSHRCYVMGGVHPDHRGSGAGHLLIDPLIDAAAQRLKAINDDRPSVVRAYLPDVDPTLAGMFERRGFTAIRWFDDLHRRVRDVPTARPPEGITVCNWDVGRSEELRLVKNSAFADHWGSEPSTEHEWKQLTASTAARLDLSAMAVDTDGTIIGLALVHRYEADDAVGPRYAWIDKVATLASHRGRGIAASLICDVITRMDDAGIEWVALGVDSDNPTGAHHLYRRLGFNPWTRYITWERWVSTARS